VRAGCAHGPQSAGEMRIAANLRCEACAVLCVTLSLAQGLPSVIWVVVCPPSCNRAMLVRARPFRGAPHASPFSRHSTPLHSTPRPAHNPPTLDRHCPCRNWRCIPCLLHEFCC
jgi:hypothetical protein